MTKQIVDIMDREKIKFEIDKNFLVEAGAGSGKTTSLVDRMVNIIQSGKFQINEIVAITFTRKAADELKHRFQTKLEKTWKEAGDRVKKERLEIALYNLEKCFLGTVHSFCARLLRERPVEAHLDLHFKELEEQDDEQLVSIAWEMYLTKLKMENDDSLLKIAETGIPLNRLKDSLIKMKDYPDVLWMTKSKEKPEIQKIYEKFIILLKEASRSIPVDPPEKGYDALQQVIIHALKKDRYQPNLKEYQMIETFELFDKKSLKPTLKKWNSKEDAKDYDMKIKVFFETHLKNVLEEWKEYCHPIIIEFLKPAFNYYEQLKKERSLLNFQDLLMKTAALLKSNSEVRKYFQQKYRCLLVDEFQDTDPIQAEIMFYLTGDNIYERNWVKCKPKPGSLFVVGDPKQAIYRFRRADIDTYNRVKALICEHGGEVLQLTMNFRTVDKVTQELNQVFSHFLPQTESTYQAAYRPLNSYKTALDTDFTGIIKLPVFGDKKEDIVNNDAEIIARTIFSLLKQHHQPNEFMILTRYNEGLDVYTRKLQEYGIPVSVSGEMAIGETKEFQELVILLHSFKDPTDEVSFVAVLRSVFFGISDEELYQWKQAGGIFSIYSCMPDGVHEKTREKFEYAINKLQLYNRWMKVYSATVVIDKIMDDIGFYTLLLARNYGQREYTRLLQIIASLRKDEERGKTTFYSIVNKLTEMVHSLTSVVTLDGNENVVRVMNVHKAKGLEAPIVFLAHPAKKVEVGSFLDYHIKREEQQSKGFFTFTKPHGFGKKIVAQPPNWETYKDEELNYLNSEEIRILYVAATRAEKVIFISSLEGKNKKNPWNFLIEGIQQFEEFDFPLQNEIDQNQEEKAMYVSMEQLKELQKNVHSWKAECLIPTYDKYSPTNEKEDLYVLEIDRESGGGKNWGLLIHELFEGVIKGHDIQHKIKKLLKKYDFSIERETEIWNIVQQFQTTKVWEQIQQAELVFTETPFTIKIDPKDHLYEYLNPEHQQPIMASGIIDLAYKCNGKWFIVDYKTDRPKKESDLTKLKDYYQNQIIFYAKVWEHLTKENVEYAQLYFVTFNTFFTLTI